MEHVDPGTIIVGGISLGTAVSLFVYVMRASAEYGALKIKVDTMWSFQMRRAVSEVAEKGIGTLNSPIHFTEQAKRALEPIKKELIAFYKSRPQVDDLMFLLEIERKFGQRLLELVCIPCQLTHGACLILALAVAKQSNILNVNLPN